MEENNGLQDILLDKNEDEKSNKTRKFLISVATLAIIFLIVLIAVKYLNSSSNEGKVADADSLLLPSEPNLDSSQDIFEQVPIIAEENTKEKFENLVNDYKNSRSKEIEQNKTNNSITPDRIAAAEQRFNEQKNTNATQNTPSVVQAPKQQEKPAIAQQNNAQAKPTPQPKPQPAPKPTVVSKPSSSQGAGNYIQVASLNAFDQNNPLIKKITSKGYNYRIYKTSVKGSEVTKILIGPFDNAELGRQLGQIKSEFNEDAFIYRIK